MAGSAVSRRLVVPVAVDALTHFQWFNLYYLLHLCDIAMTGGTYLGRHCRSLLADRWVGDISDCVWICRQVADVGFMHESHMVGHPVNPPPVDGRCCFRGDPSGNPQLLQFRVFSIADDPVTESALGYRRHASGCLCINGAVTEGAVQPQPMQFLTVIAYPRVAILIQEDTCACVNGVREMNGLLEGLIEPEHRDRLAEPCRDDESADGAHNCNGAKTPQREKRDKDLEPGGRRLVLFFNERD